MILFQDSAGGLDASVVLSFYGQSRPKITSLPFTCCCGYFLMIYKLNLSNVTLKITVSQHQTKISMSYRTGTECFIGYWPEMASMFLKYGKVLLLKIREREFPFLKAWMMSIFFATLFLDTQSINMPIHCVWHTRCKPLTTFGLLLI